MNLSLKPYRLIALLSAIVIGVMPMLAAAEEEVRMVAEEMEQSRALNEAKRQATITANVNLSAAEMSKFWPLYWEYRGAVNKIDDQLIQFLDQFAKDYQSMSNSAAKKLTAQYLGLELARYNLKKEYVAKFDTAIPAAKTLRVMQIENKLNTMLSESINKQIPLAVPDE